MGWMTGSSTTPLTPRQNSRCQSQFTGNRRRKYALYRRRFALPLTPPFRSRKSPDAYISAVFRDADFTTGLALVSPTGNDSFSPIAR
jgi:hypothetical protein